MLPAGVIVSYDAWSRHGGFVWLRQPRANHQYGYVTCRDARTNQAFGTSQQKIAPLVVSETILDNQLSGMRLLIIYLAKQNQCELGEKFLEMKF